MTHATHTERLLGYRDDDYRPPSLRPTAYELTTSTRTSLLAIEGGVVKRGPSGGLHLVGWTLAEVEALCRERGWVLRRCDG